MRLSLFFHRSAQYLPARYLRHNLAQKTAASATACCELCTASATTTATATATGEAEADAAAAAGACATWTWHASTSTCRLKSARAEAQKQGVDCVSGLVWPPPPAAPTPAPGALCPGTQFAACQCGYNGAVPLDRTEPHLWDLLADPEERHDLGGSTDPAHVAKVAELREALQVYVASAVAPLNEYPAQRKTDPLSSPKNFNPQAWTPWL